MSPTTHDASEVAVRATPTAAPLVFIVDDDFSVRESLERLVEAAGWFPEVFGSAEEFLAQPRPKGPSCLILDVGLPDLNGLEVQQLMADGRGEMPIIFITARDDIRTAVQAMKAGAVEFLTKPFSGRALLEAIRSALERSKALLEEQRILKLLRERYESLSRREREVMELVVRGHLNKQVAATLGISEITVKAHRGRVMRKMGAESFSGLVTVALRLGLSSESHPR
ncbi:MAG TPA: response regulator [Steroidobacteraceae bacterium]|jgi:FixJ family two-component response regulator|nr:response regulator [Steroidobacteraceae bacterium]